MLKPTFLPPKLYLCGFPKSGLHLAENMVAGILKQWGDAGWYGTNAWTCKRHHLKTIGASLASIRPGEYMKGHMGYLKAIEALLVGLGIGMTFVYRDMRDVIVSQAYHVTSDNDDLRHPNKEMYQDMRDMENVMVAVIKGKGEFPGVFDRWDTYAGWLESPWVLPLKFSDMRYRKRETANLFFEYLLGVAEVESGKEIFFCNGDIRETFIEKVVSNMNLKSTTYRKGERGTWKEMFTPRVMDTFLGNGGGDWLIRYGFEKDDIWLSQTVI